MTTALLDRLTHHCHMAETGNESHRFLHSGAVARKRIKEREQARPADKQPPSEVDIGAPAVRGNPLQPTAFTSFPARTTRRSTTIG